MVGLDNLPGLDIDINGRKWQEEYFRIGRILNVEKVSVLQQDLELELYLLQLNGTVQPGE